MKKMGLAALLIPALFLLTLYLPATEADNKTRPEDRDWATYVFDGSSTADMNGRCLEAYATLEQRMDNVFKQLLSEIDDEADALAKQNQEDWQRYALSKRSFDADIYRGGTLSGPSAGISYISELCRRIKELNHAIEARQPH